MIFIQELVATKKGNRWSWVKNERTNTVKQLFKTNKNKFKEENSSLYLLKINTKRLNRSFSAALKIAGTPYALVLIFTNGQKGREFNRHHQNLTSHSFSKNGEEYIKLFEGVIKRFGLYAGKKSFNVVQWNKQEPKIAKIKKLYSLQQDMFYTFEENGKVYYLECLQSVIEDMFFQCVSLAGSEHALAAYFGNGDHNATQKHVMNFKRLGFKQPKTFTLYANLFSKYLEKNIPLFEVEYE